MPRLVSINPRLIVRGENKSRPAPTREHIEFLKESIALDGQVEPIGVELAPDGNFHIVNGFMRYDAIVAIQESDRSRLVLCNVYEPGEWNPLGVVMNITSTFSR